MADQNAPVTSQGVITEGKYAGQHVSSLTQYAESLEQQLTSAQPEAQITPGEAVQQKEPESPQSRLADHAQSRISSVSDAASDRLEQDDEAEFRTELSSLGVDYDKDWKEKVDTIKANVDPKMRVSKGVHKLIYTQLRTQEPQSFAKLHDAGVVQEEEEEEEVQETQTAAETQQEIVEQAKPQPKPVTPASVSPTPAGRTTRAKKADKNPLQATQKVERLASEWGMSTDEYLKRVHQRGVTQDDIDRESVTRAERPGRMKSVFDRSTATS
jgi:hypothetical protein